MNKQSTEIYNLQRERITLTELNIGKDGGVNI